MPFDNGKYVITSETVDPKILAPNPRNPNQVSPENQEKLIQSLKRHGFAKPAMIRTLENGTREIIGGEWRIKAAIQLGIAEIPVLNFGEITDDQANELLLLDNGRYGVDDAGLLSELMSSLEDPQTLTNFLPYSDLELDVLLTSSKIDLDNLETTATTTLLEEPKIDLESKSPGSAYRVMRFKVPIEDAATIDDVIKQIMATKGFTGSDSQTNAGDALIYLCRERNDEND